jgi:hypothetical protein
LVTIGRGAGSGSFRRFGSTAAIKFDLGPRFAESGIESYHLEQMLHSQIVAFPYLIHRDLDHPDCVIANQIRNLLPDFCQVHWLLCTFFSWASLFGQLRSRTRFVFLHNPGLPQKKLGTRNNRAHEDDLTVNTGSVL